MKKPLLALAVLAAAGAAQAQVTVYGNVATGIMNTDTGGTTVTSANGADRYGSSILGFKGSEDLGGGLKASFALEQSLNVADGKLDSKGNVGFFDRKSYVELSGAFGTIQHGRAYTADEDIEGYSANGWNLFDSDTGESAGGKLPSTTKYISPSLNGVKFKISNSLSENVAGGNQMSYGLEYKAGALYAAIAAAERMDKAENNQVTVTAVGYKVGAFDVRATFHHHDKAGVSSDYTRLGATYAVGNGISITGHYGKLDAAANTSSSAYGFGIAKAFSKRTALFAGYYDKNVDGSGKDVSTTTVGVQHKF
jgi:predicted porin